MAIISDMINAANNEGYLDENADAKVCQDIILKALSVSTLSRNVTIKGGVVMEEFCFDIACFDDGANLLINSKEQMFTEKQRSLLKFGARSTRFKDVFDMCYLTDYVDTDKLMVCFGEYIYSDPGMRENSIVDVVRRVKRCFSDSTYRKRLSGSRKNWLGMPMDDVFDKIQAFLDGLK